MRRKLTVWLDSEHQLQHVTIAKHFFPDLSGNYIRYARNWMYIRVFHVLFEDELTVSLVA